MRRTHEHAVSIDTPPHTKALPPAHAARHRRATEAEIIREVLEPHAERTKERREALVCVYRGDGVVAAVCARGRARRAGPGSRRAAGGEGDARVGGGYGAGERRGEDDGEGGKLELHGESVHDEAHDHDH